MKGILIVMGIFFVIFIGFWIASKLEEKLEKHSDNITGVA